LVRLFVLCQDLLVIENSPDIGYKTCMTLQTTQINVPADFIDLGRGDPGLDLLPLDLLRKAAQDGLGQTDSRILQYGLEQGDGYFRETFSKFLSRQYGFPVDPESLFVTSGISAALDLLCTIFTKPGDTIFAEEPSYFLALKIFADRGLNVVSIQTDEAGLVIDELEAALKVHKPKLVYVIPTFQNPAGQTMTSERRKQLVDLARTNNFLVLADEVYQFLSYTQTPPASFASYIDSEHVISLGSFSKILAPGLRLGWMQTHSSIIKRILASGMLDSGGGMNPFTSAVVRNVIESGGLEKNIEVLIQTYRMRVKAMDELFRQHLPQAEYSAPHGGYFFWVRLPGIDVQELRKNAQPYQVGLRQGALFSSQNGLKDYMRLSISYYDVDQIEQGLVRLSECVNRP
jgi:2-aminoadipate transaminase